MKKRAVDQFFDDKILSEAQDCFCGLRVSKYNKNAESCYKNEKSFIDNGSISDKIR